MPRIQRALLSVSDKTHLVAFARFLAEQGVALLSTGGTAKALREAGLSVTDIAEHTGFPEMLDGRVKTLHPKVHGGLLARRDSNEHMDALETHGISTIDLVVINLYPFEETVAKRADFEECIENIDIGGPSMIRSAAKNHASVTVVVDPADYARVQDAMVKGGGDTTEALRKELAAKAYARTGSYDAAISQWFAGQLNAPFPERLTVTGVKRQVMHYGENPHQQAAFYATAEQGPSLASATLALGERLSYNNLNDASAALELVAEFDGPAVAIIKHANPCGVAIGATIEEAFAKALACDPVSAYGGVIAVNRALTPAFAEKLGKLFVEILIAPEASAEALERLSSRKKLRLLLTGGMPDAARPSMVVKTISGGFLYQEEDRRIFEKDQLKQVTKQAVSAQQMSDATFAFTVAKHVKSNAIVLVKDGATVGIGAGQMSRIDSTTIACQKAANAGFSTHGAVLASDAFFPFADNVELAAEHGIAAIIQPGGSIRDEEVIQTADAKGIGMVFTGMRHFRH